VVAVRESAVVLLHSPAAPAVVVMVVLRLSSPIPVLAVLAEVLVDHELVAVLDQAQSLCVLLEALAVAVAVAVRAL